MKEQKFQIHVEWDMQALIRSVMCNILLHVIDFPGLCSFSSYTFCTQIIISQRSVFWYCLKYSSLPTKKGCCCPFVCKFFRLCWYHTTRSPRDLQQKFGLIFSWVSWQHHLSWSHNYIVRDQWLDRWHMGRGHQSGGLQARIWGFIQCMQCGNM